VAGDYANWAWLTILSMMAIIPAAPIQVAVVGMSTKALNKAGGVPGYMLAINIFVLPIAFGACCGFRRQWRRRHVRAPLPMAGTMLRARLHWRAVRRHRLIIVETIALSTMVCNDLVMPVLLRLPGLRLRAPTSPGSCSVFGAAPSS
jgi:hypothetical protein